MLILGDQGAEVPSAVGFTGWLARPSRATALDLSRDAPTRLSSRRFIGSAQMRVAHGVGAHPAARARQGHGGRVWWPVAP